MIPRPERHDLPVQTLAFEKIWPNIKKWIGDTGGEDEENRASAWGVLHRSFGEDGYQLAKDFDYAHFEADSELVEILDEWGSCLYSAHQEVLKTWAKENPIVPLFKLGDIVTFNDGHRFSKRIHTDGEVITVDLEKLVYVLNSPSAGHIKPNTGRSGVTGTHVDFEVLHAINAKETTDAKPA